MLVSLIKNLENLEIVLASASPRRYELLRNIGLNFRVAESRVEEDMVDPHDLCKSVIANARKKGESVALRNPDALVISADTIVVINNEVMGKPTNEADARRMLEQLSGSVHQVLTGFGMIHKQSGKSLFDSVVTDVTFRELTEVEILSYINTGEPMDKAGAYGIQGQGALLIEKINGCYFNVVGFPLSRFYIKLDAFLNDQGIGG